MKIITVSREFGSGGRELGKRLADTLGIPCYDHEIIDLVAERHGFDKNYVDHISEKDIRIFYPTTIANRFTSYSPMVQQSVQVTVAQQSIIRQIANESDCVIIGRGADIILKDMNPINIFVYADQESKIARCKERAGTSENLSDKEILRKMKQIDKERLGYHRLFSETEWGDKGSYHLCINTSGKEIKTLVPAVAEYVTLWFGNE